MEQFRQNPAYLQGVQDRAYHTSQTLQEKVLQRVAKFDASHLVNNGPTAETGPSIVTRDGFVIGGSNRKMILDILAKKHPDRYAGYLQALRDEAGTFGYRPEDVDKFKRPVLVRALDFASTDKEMRELGRISGVLNKPTMTGRDKISGGVAAAKGVTRATLAKFAEGVGGYESLRGYLDSPHAQQQLIPLLEKDGVLDTQNRDQYMVDGKLTPDGKDLVEAALRGLVIPDNELLQRFRKANAEEMRTFDFGLPHMAYAKAMGEEWVSTAMSDVLRLFLDYNAHKAEWQNKHNGAQRKYDPDFYLKQPGLFGDIEGLKKNPLIREQFRALVIMSPREFAAAWKGYAAALRELRDRPTMPGVEVTTGHLRQILERVMGEYDQGTKAAPKSYKDLIERDGPPTAATGPPEGGSVSKKPETETQPELPSAGETQTVEQKGPQDPLRSKGLWRAIVLDTESGTAKAGDIIDDLFRQEETLKKLLGCL